MMAEKITIKDPCNIDKDIILVYDTGATDALSLDCENLSKIPSTTQLLTIHTATGEQQGVMEINYITLNLKNNTRNIAPTHIKTVNMGFPKPNKAPQIPNVIYNYFKKSLANFPTITSSTSIGQ